MTRGIRGGPSAFILTPNGTDTGNTLRLRELRRGLNNEEVHPSVPFGAVQPADRIS